MTRSWLSAVECTLSSASVAVLTALSKPKLRWVPLTSLSIVLGTQTTGRPLHQSWWEIWRLPSPPIETSASKPLAWKAATRSSERSISDSLPPSSRIT
jgi:hypothetical protein